MKIRATGSRIVVVSATVVLLLVTASAMAGRVLARSNSNSTARQVTPAPHTVTVSGHGDASATPDMATLSVGVQTKGIDAQSALSANAEKMNAVLSALTAQGIPADHITTSDLSLYLDSQSNTYQASHTLSVNLDNVDKVGTVLDAAVSAGANESWGVSFGLKDDSTAKAAAIRAAVTDARNKADAMASALGLSVTGVSSASESTENVPLPFEAPRAAASASSTATQVQPGQLSISSDVSIVYTVG